MMDPKLEALQGILEFLKQRDLDRLLPKKPGLDIKLDQQEMGADNEGQKPGEVLEEMSSNGQDEHMSLRNGKEQSPEERNENLLSGDDQGLLEELYKKLM